MISINEFPETIEKKYLRHLQLRELGIKSAAIGRSLAYLGLPSGEMHDIKLWRPYLGKVTAVERDPHMAMYMYQTAMMLNIRSKTIILECELAEAARLLAMEDRDVGLSVSHLFPADQDKLRRARATPYDIINLDMYGGFVYSRGTGTSENAQILGDLIKHQARHRAAFTLALTFSLRDTGKDDYVSFIEEALSQLAAAHIPTSELREYYLSGESIEGQPPQLIRLRFCVPTYVHKLAFDDFEVRSRGAWVYKTFYHTALQFEPRKGRGSLGLTWPPIDEFKRLLASPLFRLEADESAEDIERVRASALPAPTLL